MVGEEAAKKLYDAASKGDVTTVQQLLQQDPDLLFLIKKKDPDLLDRVSFACSNKTALHIATMEGNRGAVEEMLERNPQLAWELDSQNSSALHIAAAKGYVEIASLLLAEAPKVCWWRDCHGMNPIHIAAMNGHVEILEKLIQENPSPAREKVDRGQTVLHLCVKHGQIEALKVLVQNFGEVVREEDEDGYTILHMATRYKEKEIVKYLVETDLIHKNSRNSKGKTPLQMLKDSSLDNTATEIKRILKPEFSYVLKLSDVFVRETREMVMVVMVLIATMAFQAVVSPPGGVWQDNSSTHKAGEAVMASTHPKIYKSFVRTNTVAFVSSIVVIVLLTLGESAINLFSVVVISYSKWVTLASVAVSYGASVTVITPNSETQSLSPVINIVVAVSVSLFAVLHFHPWYKAWKSHKQSKAKETKTEKVLHQDQDDLARYIVSITATPRRPSWSLCGA